MTPAEQKLYACQTWQDFLNLPNQDLKFRMALYPLVVAAMLMEHGGPMQISSATLRACLAKLKSGDRSGGLAIGLNGEDAVIRLET